MDSDEDDNTGFAKQGGEALDIDEDAFDDSEEEEEDEAPQIPQNVGAQHNMGGSGEKKGGDIKGEHVENQPFDLAVEVNDDEEIESEEEDEVNIEGGAQPGLPAPNKLGSGKKRDDDDEDDDDDAEVQGAYNPNDYATLKVNQEVKDLFEYITRYKPQKISLDTKMKPFIPDYIPAVGEVDAFLKMPRPDTGKEELGVTVLDEPALNCEDKTTLELKYVQLLNVPIANSIPITVESIENADKKPKEVNRWIQSIADLHKTKPAPTVNYTKQMPEFDTLMEEWSPQMEQALHQIPFPGPDIDMHIADYSRLICAMMDIPIHKLANNKSVIESLNLLFTLFIEFRDNVHFQNKGNMGAEAVDPALANF